MWAATLAPRTVNVFLGILRGRMALEIADDGAGFDPNSQRRGLGLANMHARASEFDGIFELSSAPGAGTTITFSVPYQQPPTPGEQRKYLIGSGAMLLLGAVLCVRSLQIGLIPVAIGTAGLIRQWAMWRSKRSAR